MPQDNRMEFFYNECGYDYTIETRDTPDFLEIVSSMGGDITTSRVYGSKDGSPESFYVTER